MFVGRAKTLGRRPSEPLVTYRPPASLAAAVGALVELHEGRVHVIEVPPDGCKERMLTTGFILHRLHRHQAYRKGRRFGGHHR